MYKPFIFFYVHLVAIIKFKLNTYTFRLFIALCKVFLYKFMIYRKLCDKIYYIIKFIEGFYYEF